MEIKHINWGYILHFMPIQSKYYFLKEPLQKVIICGWTTKSTAFEVCQKLNSQEQRKCCLITAFSVLKATSNESIKRKRLNPEIAVKFDLNTRSTKNQCYSDIISCMVCLSVTHNSLSLLSEVLKLKWQIVNVSFKSRQQEIRCSLWVGEIPDQIEIPRSTQIRHEMMMLATLCTPL